MYEKIVVQLDGSKLAEAALPYAEELAAKQGSDIILLTVVESEEVHACQKRQMYTEKIVGVTRRHAKKYIGNGASKAIKVGAATRTGNPAEAIIEYTNKGNSDLIVMASHGRSGISRWAVGSVADKVLRAAKVPVWLIHSGIAEEIVYDKWLTRRVLVPLDGSQLAEAVVPHAEEWAIKRGTERVEVVLLRVCEPPSMPSYSIPEFSGVPLSWGE